MITMESALNPLPQFPENSYKMTEEDVKRLIEFRASNEALFTGKRNSAKIAWSTILKGLGLEGKLTADQIAKKWDNLRTKYKDLKQPYQGQDHIGGVVESWPWFHIMDEAMHGRLYNSNLVLSPETAGNAGHRCNNQPSQNQENTDILEFLIKTEMEDTVAQEAAEHDGTGHAEAAPAEGVPMGWRRMSECSYKMTEPETERMIKLRAANEALFTGRKHSAKPAWRAILYELGLQGKLTTDQLAKKWDNLKRRYKVPLWTICRAFCLYQELKFPARGVETNPSSWPWFYRMNDAMEGRFAGGAPILTPIVEDEDEDCEPLSPTPKKRARRSRGGMAEFLTESEMDLLVDNEDKNGSTALGDLQRMAEFTYKLTEEDTRRLIELRAANESLFTGRRNTAKPAWRGIVKEMGLTGKITPDQVAKKWDNLKTKFKDLKFPPRGMEGQTNPASWPWFQLMSDALEGRLAGKAPRVTPVWSSEEDGVFGSSPPPDRDCLMAERSSVSELESMVGGDTADADGNVTYIDASGEECSTPSDLSYKMTDQDTRRMIKLRAANEALFTGRRNAAKAAWKAILKELGLQGKVSTYQMAKKWDNLKRRYKDLKYPPVGMENVADSTSSWPWFNLMNEAMEGRLTGSAPLLTPVTQDDEQHPDPAPRHRSRPAPPPPPSSSSDYGQEAFSDAGEQNQRVSEACDGPLGGLEREWEMVERDRAALERDREMVERDRASVERERAAVQAERLWLERERAAVERDRAMVEQERATLGREREVLDQRALMLNSVGHSGHLNSLM
ncbi:uncharacterized protein LOC119487258 isoform X1 [Sebastes umbrosus]|uniref:uncharacterized protein LOC119487258 isoform X1 n=1 Tax=Sebastes umbrosus TaxID=72105 RepID=UPI00189C6993|nr:uncharacterized protein LOC119487258 isoform X1 [Sebastes umbrosus]